MADDPKQQKQSEPPQQQKAAAQKQSEAATETAEVAADAGQQALEKSGNVIQAAGYFQQQNIQTFQQNIRRWQEVQMEALRAGADILFIQMDMMNKLTACRRPDQAVSIGEEAYKAAQDRVISCMDQYRDLAARQYETMNEMMQREVAQA